ncbi:MAG: RDD family protein [Agrococcus casei]|uniref:RDD family protein n=1 Tax=Agrococcus casei TaxID=343512 RepID=UPI003F931E50
MIWEIDDKKPKIEGLDEDGRPDPQYAADLGLVPAPLGRRAVSSLIEFAIYGLLVAPFYIFVFPYLLRIFTGTLDWYGFFQHPNFIILLLVALFSTVLALAFIIVQIALHGSKGVTIGKAFVGIRSINVKTLEKPKIGRALLRALVMYLSFMVPVIGPVLMFVSVFFDGEKRGRSWLDYVGNLWFIDIKKGLNPYDSKRMRIARKTLSVDATVEQEEQLPFLATAADARVQQSAPSAYVAPARTSSGVLGAASPSASAPSASAPPASAPQQPQQQAPVQQTAPVQQPPQQPQQPAQPIASAPPAPASAPYRPGSLSGVAPQQQPAPQQAAPQQSAPRNDGWSDATQIATPRPAVQPQAPVGGETIAPDALPDDVAETRLSSGRRPQQQPIVAVIQLDTGDRFDLSGSALIGRNPRPEPGETVAHALPIEDPTQSISKTHLFIEVTPAGISVVDRHSTNGSALDRQGTLTELVSGVPVPVQPGDVVRFGDRSLTFALSDQAGAS